VLGAIKWLLSYWKSKHTDCVEVCPIDFFYDVPADQHLFIALNAELARHKNWTRITKQKAVLAYHEQWKMVTGKLENLERNGA